MIQSYITMKPIVGFDPIGYVPFVEPAAPNYITNHVLYREFDEVTFFPIGVDVSLNQQAFLDALQLDLDTNYAATSFTDATRDYLIDYKVIKIERVYAASSSNIFEQRQYIWKITTQVKVNTNA